MPVGQLAWNQGSGSSTTTPRRRNKPPSIRMRILTNITDLLADQDHGFGGTRLADLVT
nr:hypothetical protein [Kibdelosporangium sp. MJ126-NF4]CEL17931.1 hypothetical protein [Kibdelosporangium sp. MJ126-NF4]CTQ90842.1 hypothetical protein [Kibdelosporangium sp. MJ126-NF4]